MGDKSKIEWTDSTWNVCTGCSKVSQGCRFCYALRDWPRLSSNPKTVYAGRKFTDVQVHPERLGLPMRWQKPRRIFVNSMSDLFHEQIPFEFIAAVFAIMGVTTRHTYQILTKRPERMLEFFRWCADESEDWMKPPTGEGWQDQPDAMFIKHSPYLSGTGPYNNLLPWKGYDNCGPVYPYENVWLGVSVENQETADERIPLLLETPAAVRFLSCEPLLGPIDLSQWLEYHKTLPGTDTITNERSLQWVITGGESGPKARPSNPQWFREIRNQCLDTGVAYCHKQNGEWASVSEVEGWGEIHEFPDLRCVRRVGKKRAGRTLDGQTWDQYPE